MKRIALLFLLIAVVAGCGTYTEGNNTSENPSKNVSGNIPAGQEEQKQTTDTDSEGKDQFMESIAQSGLQVGSKPPELTLETLAGELFDQEVIKDKKVILNFWATWCGPCRLEMPDIAQLASEHADDLVVVAVNLKEDNEMVTKFVEELGLEDFHILLDRTGELADQFQIIALPTTYFLNSDGTIGYKHIGFMNYDQFKEVYQKLN